MKNTRGSHAQTENHHVPTIYEIRIKGHLDVCWMDRFENMTINLEESGNTHLTGKVADQSALFGLLRRVRDCGMVLLSVTCVDHDQEESKQRLDINKDSINHHRRK